MISCEISMRDAGWIGERPVHILFQLISASTDRLVADAIPIKHGAGERKDAEPAIGKARAESIQDGLHRGTGSIDIVKDQDGMRV